MPHRKKLVVYCSILSHTTPPHWLFETAKTLSHQYPVIFIELPGISAHHNWKEYLSYISWVIQFITQRKQLTIWNSTQWISKYLLRSYLLILKHIFRWKIVCITTVPYDYGIYHFIPADTRLFDCTDQYADQEFQEQQGTIETFDQVFTNTKLLTTLLKRITPKVSRISSGYCDGLTLAPTVAPKLAYSVIFSGGISRRIDYQLLLDISRLLPKFTFFFMGEVYLQKHYATPEDEQFAKKWQELLSRPNVKYLGAYTSEQTHALLPYFEVGIIPYTQTDTMNYHSHPIKLYEYMAARLPIVSTSLPSVREHLDSVPLFIADRSEDFARKVRSARSTAYSSAQLRKVQRTLTAQSMEKKVGQIQKWI